MTATLARFLIRFLWKLSNINISWQSAVELLHADRWMEWRCLKCAFMQHSAEDVSQTVFRLEIRAIPVFFTQCRMVIPYRRFGTNYPSSSWSFKKLKNERKRFVTSFLSITAVLTRCDRLYHQATCLAFTIAAVFNGDRTEWGFSSAVLQMMYHSHEMGETRRMNNWRDER